MIFFFLLCFDLLLCDLCLLCFDFDDFDFLCLFGLDRDR